MQFFNTLTKTKEKLIPRNPSTSSGRAKIQMFVCGPTVYDYVHIGNARTFVFFDVVAKYLRKEGYGVDYIQNITDIDDKIIAKAKENNRDPLEHAKEYFEKFKTDMQALGVDSPRYIPATECIEQVVKQVKTLIEKGFAYEIPEGGWYFDLSKFPEYGKLSGRKTQMADDAVSRIDESDKKKNKGDFALWKFSKEDEPSWDFETSKYLGISDGSPAFAKASAGRPGWHIEDTAITEHYFGPQYDIHGGGQDLIFPHHEAEITQQESASGKKPFVKYWMHVAFLIVKDYIPQKREEKRPYPPVAQKMSKSLGNFETIHELLKKYPKEVLRFYLLSSFYRSPLDYSDMMFNQAQAAVNRISEFVQKLEKVDGSENKTIEIQITNAKEEFLKAMDNDFNTPEAFAVIFNFIRSLNPAITANEISRNQAKEVLKLLTEINEILGIIPTEYQKIPDEVQELVEKREKARQEKNYEDSDKIRARIHDLGWEIEDTVYGPWVRKF